ncbi:unnamed protein product [Calicophoron daubneyi]|uniref:Uncharacterized protein n=1 Tax=Calicophoron daubneyi TaxID=300641 RepID=A0AAV2TQ94_CALDB
MFTYNRFTGSVEMCSFVGTWKCASKENIDKFLEQIGASKELAQKAVAEKTVITITHPDSQTVHFKFQGPDRVAEETSKLSAAFEHRMPSGKTVNATLTKESDTRLKMEYSHAGKPVHTIYEIHGNELCVTSTAGDVTAVSKYIKE